jgi:hypothetical protein
MDQTADRFGKLIMRSDNDIRGVQRLCILQHGLIHAFPEAVQGDQRDYGEGDAEQKQGGLFFRVGKLP